jgi:hypothetical protein
VNDKEIYELVKWIRQQIPATGIRFIVHDLRTSQKPEFSTAEAENQADSRRQSPHIQANRAITTSDHTLAIDRGSRAEKRRERKKRDIPSPAKVL